MTVARALPAAALVGLLFLSPSPARAEVKLDEQGKVTFSGDFRFRLESDWDSMASNGTERDDRDRARVRLRLAFGWAPTSHVKFHVRGRSGNTNNQQSPHVTVIQSGDRGDADVLVDRAFAQFGWKDGFARVGRTGHPFWQQDEFLFDDDVWFDGLSFHQQAGGDAATHEVNAMFAAVPEGEASLPIDEQGWLAALQYAFHRHLPAGDFTAALSGYRTQDDDSVLNPVLLDQDWLTWELSVQQAFSKLKHPVTVGGNVFHNSDGPDSAVFNHGETDAFTVLVNVGQLKKRNDWQAGYSFAHVEKYALVPFLAQDDWVRWGSATQTRSSNYEGHELRFAWQIAKNMSLMARLFVVHALELESATAVAKEDGNRLRIDYNWKW